jgi:hypothetical protein
MTLGQPMWPSPGMKSVRAIVVTFVTVRAFEGANVWVGNEGICALAGYYLSPLHGKALKAGFAFDKPDQSHLSASQPHRQDISIPTFGLTTRLQTRISY